MKRFIAMLLVLIVTAVPAFAAYTFSPFDFVTGSAGGGRFLYYDFPDISLYLPADWAGLFTVEQSANGAAFYQTDSYEKYQAEGIPGGGFLFELCASEDESFRELPAYAYLGYSENAGLHFYLMLSSDYPAYPDDAARAEYDAMAEEIDAIVEMVHIAPSLSFYTDDIISTDVGMS